MKVYRVKELSGGVTCGCDTPGGVADILSDSDEGSEYTITVVEMTPEAYAALPEFEGF